MAKKQKRVTRKDAAPKKVMKRAGEPKPGAARKFEGGPNGDYKCQTTLTPGECLMFTKDSKGRYNQPPGGTRVNCSICKGHYFP
jgi:hypothetical protein